MALVFDGELAFTVEGPGGATAGTVTGDGRTLRVHADDPVAAWDAAVGSVSTGPAAVAAVAGQLHDEGVVVEVSGPDGLVASIGAGVHSPLGRLLVGSSHVRLGRLAAVRPLAVAELRRRAESRPVVAVLVAAGLIATPAVTARLLTVWRRRAR